jgi:Cd2+/Zn2+-exporting ATPase
MQIDLPDVLPDVPDSEDPCVRRLLASVGEREGVLRAHLIAAAAGESATLCIHFDPEEIGRSYLRKVILTTGTRLCEQFGHATWMTAPLSDSHWAETASEKLREIRGVIAAEVEPDRRIRIEYDRKRIQKAELRGVLTLMGIQVEQ